MKVGNNNKNNRKKNKYEKIERLMKVEGGLSTTTTKTRVEGNKRKDLILIFMVNIPVTEL